jgi:uncharacterized protein
MLFIGRFSAFLFFHFAFPTQPGKNRYREKTVNTSAVNLKPFSLLVKPASADCNLRCSYCFYPEKCRHYPITAKHRRPEAVLENLIRGYLSTDQPVYTFGWQGGEPMLMGLDFFAESPILCVKFLTCGIIRTVGPFRFATLIPFYKNASTARATFVL